MNTKENVLCEERKEKRKSGGRCEYKYREVQRGRAVARFVRKHFRRRKKEGGMMTRRRQVGYGGVVWAATNERRWLCDSFCVRAVCEVDYYCALLLPFVKAFLL